MSAIREAQSTIKLLLEIEGELDRRGVVHVALSEDWIEVPAVLLNALQSHLEADTLAGELQDRTAVSNRGHASFNARSDHHNDLVIAAGLRTGTGEKTKPMSGGIEMVGRVSTIWVG